MNRFKKYILMLRSFYWLTTLGIILLIIVPIFTYNNKPETHLNLVDLTEESEGLNWVIDNEKMRINENVKLGNPDVILIDNYKKLDDHLIKSIEGNIVISEMLFDGIGNNIEMKEYIEKIIDVKYTGFTGKQYNDLSNMNEIPEQIVLTYEKNMKTNWDFYGEGIVLFNEQTVIVLEEDVDYKSGVHLRVNGLSAQYTGYFEVLESKRSSNSNNQFAAEFVLETTGKGDNKLSEYNLQNTLPAMIKVSNRLYDWHYFAGAFSKIPVTVPSNYNLMPQLMKNKIIYDTSIDEELYWKWYQNTLVQTLKDRKKLLEFSENDKVDNNLFKVDGKVIYKSSNDVNKQDQAFFMKGVNLGAALPGKTFTEFPMQKETYLNWLTQMADLNMNTLRTYTLLPPVFYDALKEFNDTHDQTIYLLQEIWPEEHPYMHNYLGEDYNKEYRKEIEYMVHAIHGNMNLPRRSYRAYGMYTSDVSEYLIGYLVGREMEPDEVQVTDNLNRKYEFNGRYLYSENNASPTEAWLASACDYALQIEDSFYSDKPIVGIVSWPTLDPKQHDSEWNTNGDKSRIYNDSTIVDINNIGIRADNTTGFIGAYHIYPNYPDFMNNEAAYDAYEDSEGRFRYGGYLEEFMEDHSKYPAVVAEYGISTSAETAHFTPDGYNHGGLSELDQAKGIIRMTESIIKEGYSGALIFEWMDEWAKKTWTTEPFMIPYERQQFWHNVLDPEQNYGLLSIEASDPVYETAVNADVVLGEAKIERATVAQNEAFVYLQLTFSESLDLLPRLALAINTVGGQDTVNEFILTTNSSGPDTMPNAQLLVNPGYNWTKGKFMADKAPYASYESMVMLTNKENIAKDGTVTTSKSVDLSHLGVGDFDDNRNNIMLNSNIMTIRIPYGLLGVSDPSSKQVLSDSIQKIPVLRNEIKTTTQDHIYFSVLNNDNYESFNDNTFEDIPIIELKLTSWELPKFKARLKNGFSAIAEYFDEIK